MLFKYNSDPPLSPSDLSFMLGNLKQKPIILLFHLHLFLVQLKALKLLKHLQYLPILYV